MERFSAIVVLFWGFMFFSLFSASSPAPSPDFKSVLMDGIRKIPSIVKSSIPMPENVAITVNVDNRKGAVAAESSQDRTSSDNGRREFLSANDGNGNSKMNEISDHHILAMIVISVIVFALGTIFVLTLWFCFRRRKVQNTIAAQQNNHSDSKPARAFNPKAEELLPKMPNVQKLIANFDKK